MQQNTRAVRILADAKPLSDKIRLTKLNNQHGKLSDSLVYLNEKRSTALDPCLIPLDSL